jgi:hypothetical protein
MADMDVPCSKRRCSCSVAMLTGQDISLYLVFNPNFVKMNLGLFLEMMICCLRLDVIVA